MRTASVVFLLLFASCGIINNSGAGRLTKEQHIFVKPFTELENRRFSDTFRLLETDGKMLRRPLTGKSYTWVYFWTYYCKGKNCQSLRYYTDLYQFHNYLTW